MYLTKMEMELSNPCVRAALKDTQKLHRLVSGLFNASRKDANVLFCKKICGTKVYLYIYSNQPVIHERILPYMHLLAQQDISNWLKTIENGQKFGFHILTMPFKKIATEGCQNSQRKSLSAPIDRLTWLERKANQCGFLLLDVTESLGERINARHNEEKGGSLTMNSWRYTGHLQITDRDAFCKSLCNGIGPGKAYGLGMLILSRG